MDDFEVEDYVDGVMLRADSQFEETENTWHAIVPDLNGLWGAGDTRPEALADLRQAVTAWVYATLDAGEPLPAAD